MLLRSQQYRHNGFTLLEVLVALAVVSLALTALVKSSGSMAANTAYLQQKNIAHWIAFDRIAELDSHQEWPSKGTKRDDVKMYGAEWTWIQEVTETTYKDMRRVDVSVILTDEDEDFPLITMTGFLINPQLLKNAPSQAGNSAQPNNNAQRHE